MDELWMVYDNEDGLVCITSKEEAETEYERRKEILSQYDEFYGEERLVLSKVMKNFYLVDIGNNIADFKEDVVK